MNIKEEIKKMVEKSIGNLQKRGEMPNFEIPDILVEKPGESKYGDYATSVSALISKITKEEPLIIAEKICRELKSYEINYLQDTTVDGPVFNNFYIKDEFFYENTKIILKERENFGSNQILEYKKIIIEYTDPNPFKEFHIGHLMSNTIGEALSRIFEFHGATVKRVCYQGDVGLHVAKAVWGLLQVKDNKYFVKEAFPLAAKIRFLGAAYVNGSEQYEKDENARKEIHIVNKKIFEGSDREVNKLYNKGKVWSLAYFHEIYDRLGTKFDQLIFESEVSALGRKNVEDGLTRGIFEKGEQGAIIFRGEKYGLHTRVFINSDGLPTYEAKELALAKEKYDQYKYDQSFIITGNEINEYFKVLLYVMGQFYPELAEKTKHIGHGMLRLPTGKMSSRTGNVVTLEFLLNQVETLVGEKIADRIFFEVGRKEVTEKVTISALKYSILKRSIGSDVIYDFNKSISFEGDSGPYLQYSFARANSVLERAKKEKIKTHLKNIPSKITQLEKSMIYFPEVVEKAGKEYEPHFIVLYLTELAREFNNYYANNKIVDISDEFSPNKVALTEAFSIIMKNGLWLLGIETLKKM